MYKSKWLVAATICGAMLVGQHHHAHSAEFKAFKQDKNFWIISIDGEIVFNDDLKFKQLVAKNKISNAAVFLASPGGNMLAGLDIGFQIHNYGFRTWVPDGLYCQSICAVIWMGGDTRYSSSSSHIGFHSVATYKLNKDGTIARDKNGNTIREESDSDKYANELVASYYHYLGINEKTSNFLTSEDPENMAWMTFDKAKELDIAIEPFEGKKEKTTMRSSK